MLRFLGHFFVHEQDTLAGDTTWLYIVLQVHQAVIIHRLGPFHLQTNFSILLGPGQVDSYPPFS